MTVLRMAPDNTLAETLGNLGGALKEGFNPLNRMRAYELQQQMWLHQQELLAAQRKNAAQFDAVRHFAQFVPQEFLPMVATMVYQNAPWDQVTRFVALHSGHLIDADTPEALAKNIEFMRQIDPNYSYQKDGPPVGGRVTADAFDKWKATQAGEVARTTALGTKTGEQQAAAPYVSQLVDDASPAGIQKNIDVIERWEGKPYDYSTRGPPVKGPQTQAAFDDWKAKQAGVIAGQTAMGTKVGEQTAMKPYLDKLVDDPSPAGIQKNIEIIQEAEGKVYDYKTRGPPVKGPLTQKAFDDWTVTQSAAKTKADERARLQGGGLKADEPRIFPDLPDATTSPVVQQAPVVSAAPNAAPLTPKQARQLREGYSISGYTVSPVANMTDMSKPIGFTKGAPEAAQKETEGYYTDLSKAYEAGGEPATKLKNTIRQLQALSQVAQTGGAYGGITSGPLRDLLDQVGLSNITDAQMAQSTMDNLLKGLIPELKGDYNLTRVAQPEIALLSTVTGTSRLPPKVMSNILANLDAGADLSMALREQARRVLMPAQGGEQQAPFDYPDYATTQQGMFNKYGQVVEQRRSEFGTVNAAPQPDAQPQTRSDVPLPRQTTGNPIADFFGSISHIFGGGEGEQELNPDGTPKVR